MALIQLLKEITGFKVDWRDDKLKLIADGKTYTWATETRSGIRNIHLPMLEQGTARKQPTAVITDYLFHALRESFRKAGIGYLDTVGNIKKFGVMMMIKSKT